MDFRVGRISEAVVRNAILSMYALFALFPIFWMVLITFKSDAEMYTTTFLFHPTLENYREVLLRTDYFKAFWDNLKGE